MRETHRTGFLPSFAAGVTLLLGVALFASPASAQGASGSTDVSINIPDIVILHYYSSVDITIGSSEFGTFLTGSPGNSAVDEGAIAPAAGGFTQDLAISPSPLSGDPTAAVLVLENAWAVRAVTLFGGAGRTELTITNASPTLNHTTTAASMTITDVAVDDGTSNDTTIDFPTPGMGSPQVGDVELTLDMTNATDAGDYQGGQYTLTATNI